MRKQAVAGTKPETGLARELRRRGFTVNQNVRELPGTPDIVLPVRMVAVFVNGCFWHGCPFHHVPPKHNRNWWKAKIARNKERDRLRAAQLRRMGWSALTVWEHTDARLAADRVQRIARTRHLRKP